MESQFQVSGTSQAALFSLKLHRGDGMTLIGMNWKVGRPPKDFVGFAIECKEPAGDKFFALKNRLSFPGPTGSVDPTRFSTLRSPIQKFRWVHFPRNAEIAGEFTYKVTPVFMNDKDELSYGEPQSAAIELRRETFPGLLNVSFTRGFVASQAFVDRYESAGPISELLPKKADEGLKFKPSHSKAKEALAWMGFEARHAILELLDQAIADKQAQVRVVAYDLSEPDILKRLEKIGKRLKVIIDDDGAHAKEGSGETQSAKRLMITAGTKNVKRQHMGSLQHNKTIVVDGPTVKAVVCGSTNFTWRGLFVQSNNALVLKGEKAVKPFLEAFENYWQSDLAGDFGETRSAKWIKLGLDKIDVSVSFSPHSASNALLESIADDISAKTTSSLFYSLAFLFQTTGPILDAIKKVSSSGKIFVYGISDKKVGGLDLQKSDGNVSPVFPSALKKEGLPEPFKSEPTGGGGNRMHHKFIVVDFDKPTARVYLGSYNFSKPADRQNGENLLLIKDRRVAVSYMIEALRIFDHYHFRVAQQEASKARSKLTLARPPRKAGEKPWWTEDFTIARKIRDRDLFS